MADALPGTVDIVPNLLTCLALVLAILLDRSRPVAVVGWSLAAGFALLLALNIFGLVRLPVEEDFALAINILAAVLAIILIVVFVRKARPPPT